jgi:hypothetical protein
VTERRLSSQLFAAACTLSAVTFCTRSGQVLRLSTVSPVVSAPPYQRAIVAWLSWA